MQAERVERSDKMSTLLLLINLHPRTDHEGPEGEQRYSSTLSLTSLLD
jgi:hypothetical protein